jgi:arsenate reductase
MERTTLLFVCIRNAGRSQIAAAFAERFGGNRLHVLSAGSEPADTLHPEVVAAMLEIGIDLSDRRPRRLTPALLDAAEVVVTMGCGDECPAAPGRQVIEWDLDDPGDQPIERARIIRDEIATKVRALLDELA